MKNFNLYILKHNFHNPETPILIPIGSSHQSTTSYPQGTYNEKLTNKPNSQAQLTFNISTTYNGQRNRNADFMINGQRLRIVFNNDKNTCLDFFITKVAPAVTQNNSILTITAVDWFSYELSHTAIGLTYDSLDYGGARSIQDLTTDILQLSSVANWNISRELIDSRLPRFYDAEDKTQPMRITFSVSGSNCYNALIEIAKKFDATIIPTYNWNGKGGEVNFINNNDFTSNIYHLSPTVNINNFGVNQQSNNLATIMYVTGGEDTYGNPVTLTPQMNGAFKYWLLSRICYDESKKPSCLEHNYPILYTKSFNSTNQLYNYKKYTNSLYSSTSGTLTREMNSLSNKYAGLYATYDRSETIVFTIPQSSGETEGLKVYINNEEYNGFKSKVQSYTTNSTEGIVKLIEVSIPASDFTDSTITLWAGYGTKDSNNATINLITSSWIATTDKVDIKQIWEAQNTMMDIYDLFLADWNSTVAINTDKGLAGFKSVDITNTVYGAVYNYCKYIDNNVPAAGNFLYNFDYLLENRLMTPVEYYGLNYVLSHDVRNYNLLINIYSELYYELKYQTALSLATIKTYLTTFLAEIETHMQNINEADENDQPVNPTMPVTSNVLNIIQSREDKSKLIPTAIENDNADEEVNLDYYTNSCHNKLLEILSNILREGLTSQYVKNCVSLYGKDFFNDIELLFKDDSSYKVFQDKTAEYFDYLYEYDVLLNRTIPTGQCGSHNFNYQNEIYDEGRALEANRVLALASDISKQASYWYDSNYNIYQTKPENIKVFYHPNYKEAFLNIIEEFVLNSQSPYYAHISSTTTNFNLVDFYENLLEENKELWDNIRNYYGNFLWEATYNDSTELTTSGLYNAALLSFSKVNKPIYNYTITSIDASQLINTGTENVKVGDRISINHPAVFPKPNYKKTNIRIINTDTTNNLIKYRVPQKGAVVKNINFTRYNLAESEDLDVEIYDQILGSKYGELQGAVISSDSDTHEFTVEWENEWTVYGIDLLNTLNYGTNLFFGDYNQVASIADYSTSKSYKGGDWFYDSTSSLPNNRGYKVYQVGKAIKQGTTLSDAKKSAYRVDVYYNATIANLSDGDLYVSSGKLYQKYTQAATDVNGDPISIATGKEIYSYPIYADFVYEPDELLLTITGVTQTLRENKTQLQVQDNSLINSLVDKLLYSVRFS